MKIAIVGGGIAGLAAAYYLSEHHQLTLFEQNDYVGGHTNTVSVREETKTYHVDTGFIVFNDRTYPNFCELLQSLKVESQATEMSFGLKCSETGLEYSGTSLGGFYAQRQNLFSWKQHRLLWDILRFHRLARRLHEALSWEMTVGEFFSQHGFSQRFREQFFMPMGSAIWSCPRERLEQFPVRFIVEFYLHHGLLGLRDRPQWKVIKGGSYRYVDALLATIDMKLKLADPVVSVRRLEQGVQLNSRRGGEQLFDHVVLACHSDQALKIVSQSATVEERELLACFPYQRNQAILHTDTSILPLNRNAWACWNYLLRPQLNDTAVVTYNMNKLQGLDAEKTYCVSLNVDTILDRGQILAEFVYHHPVFNTRRAWAQSQHDKLIDHQSLSYCGAYWGNGFHEDGVCSALAVARKLIEVSGS